MNFNNLPKKPGFRSYWHSDGSEAAYPFSAIVGQEKLKRALSICSANPEVRGVLIRGEKGTAKSTAVRGLAGLLPEIEVVDGCSFACDPARPSEWCEFCRKRRGSGRRFRPVKVLTLPLNATEDRVIGGIDFQRAVVDGRRSFEPGLLASAHRGILYIDEVNLLDDHLVDVILDSAAAGVVRVEREGVSFRIPSRFVLVGTMNPEEGELRPQLLDRFGLCVEVSGERDFSARVELMKRREEFDADPWKFLEKWRQRNERFSSRITEARRLLKRVQVGEERRREISALCRQALVAGHRADLIMERCAATIAALEGRPEISTADIEEAAFYVLLHRAREPNAAPDFPASDSDENASPPENRTDRGESATPESAPNGGDRTDNLPPSDSFGSLEERIFAVGSTFKVKRIETRKDRIERRGSGRRSHTRSAQMAGRYTRSRLSDDCSDLALDATIRAAAPFQKARGGSGLAVEIRADDLRKKIRERKIGNFIVFAVDASGSMGAKKRMISTKGAVMSLLLDAYRMRDRIAMVAFRQSEAEVLLPPTNSVALASRLLETLPTGGKTPLSAGIAGAYKLARGRLLKDPFARPIVFFITDGRGNVPLKDSAKPSEEALSIAGKISVDKRISYVVVDTENNGFLKFGLAESLAGALKAKHYKIENLRASDLVQVVKEHRHE